nr:PREDICTED: AT-rich interactive domain-containing protein 1-like isoform X2 [Daucus carota subsp. sativus]
MGQVTDLDKLNVELKSQDTDDVCNGKRKRVCLLKSLNWARRVANDPCNLRYGSIPESSKWKHFGTNFGWKLFLSLRQAMMVERNGDSSFVQSIWQKQKMLPTMYEETKRCSQRISSAKTSEAVKKSQAQHFAQSTSSNAKSGFWLESCSKIEGDAQAEIPEWMENFSSDSKWLGTRIWPQETGVDSHCLIEKDPVGLGRRDLCDCENKGSLKCVRFHVSEERIRLQHELGTAFYQMQIDKMGEEVALSWTNAEEMNFVAVVVKSKHLRAKRKNSESSSEDDEGFWKELLQIFPNKTRQQLVSYYYNVFLLRQRALQNRSTAVEISSDDENRV